VTRFEVVFETALYRSVFVEAADREEAETLAVENHFPASELPLPPGYDLNPDWFVEGTVRVRDDD
jgi:hypothetical protein